MTTSKTKTFTNYLEASTFSRRKEVESHGILCDSGNYIVSYTDYKLPEPVGKDAKVKCIRETWDYGDNYSLIVDGSKIESQSTKNFTLKGFLGVYCNKYSIDKETVSVSDECRKHPVVIATQKDVFNDQIDYHLFDPREQSNDFDPDEIHSYELP